jgi:hypothetical protein
MVEYKLTAPEMIRDLDPAILKCKGGREMNLRSKSELVRSLIENLKLPKGFSLTEPTTSVGKNAIGSPEHIHTFEHEMNGEKIQAFQVYISGDGVTLQYEYSNSYFQPFTGSNHIEKAVEDVRKYLKSQSALAMAQGSGHRQRHSSDDCY